MNLIVAADNKWGIGKDGGLLAHLPTDMKYFREHTEGKAVVMGRKTLESLPGKKGLPKRVNYVLTKNPDFKAERCIAVHTEDELWDAISRYDPENVWLIGGATLYNWFYNLGADTFITNFDEDPDFEIVSESEPVTENGITYRFVVYEKKAG